jgi:Ca-activated chloride channel family protein
MPKMGKGVAAAAGVVLVWCAVGLVAAPQRASAVTLTDKLHSRVQKGNKLYDKGEHDKALDQYREAQKADSTNVVPQFNAGDALYKMGKYPEGAKEFTRAASSSADSVSAMSYYNLGNSAFRSNDYRAAAEAYKRALMMAPDDEDTKYNLEYALRMIQQQQQQQQNQDNQRQTKDQQSEQNQENQQDQQQNNQQRQQTQGQDHEQDQSGQQGAQGQMTQEELKRILAAVQAADEETQRELLKQSARLKRISDKDW